MDKPRTRIADEWTRHYVHGLVYGLYDLAERTYGYRRQNSASAAFIEGYHDALDDSDDERDETRWHLVHVIDARSVEFRTMCNSEERVFLWNARIQNADCPDCQAAYDSARDSDDMPDPIDLEETLVP